LRRFDQRRRRLVKGMSVYGADTKTGLLLDKFVKPPKPLSFCQG
jgi:hypothetical protein